MGIDGKEIADQLVREGYSHPLIGPRRMLCISEKVARHNQGAEARET
jgi:hypothetical protein